MRASAKSVQQKIKRIKIKNKELVFSTDKINIEEA
jgi:hypothetical protein